MKRYLSRLAPEIFISSQPYPHLSLYPPVPAQHQTCFCAQIPVHSRSSSLTLVPTLWRSGNQPQPIPSDFAHHIRRCTTLLQGQVSPKLLQGSGINVTPPKMPDSALHPLYSWLGPGLATHHAPRKTLYSDPNGFIGKRAVLALPTRALMFFRDPSEILFVLLYKAVHSIRRQAQLFNLRSI